ncbi:S24 family peptidase [Pseudomonas sp. Z4-20]|uniref:S24 family peptidase n=1 Tax=Pseudomonas sp. Z4-20 TaxID=2817414 RepID=UPI003DAA2FA4
MDQQYVYFLPESSPVNSVFMDKENSGYRLRKCLHLAQKTPSEIAQATGVSNQTVNNWFVRGVPGRKILQVAKFLEIRPEWLQDGEGSPLSEEEQAELSRVMDASAEQRAAWAKEARRIHAMSAANAFRYPVIPWTDMVDCIDPQSLSSDSAIKWHSSDAWAGDRGFWVEVEGASMASMSRASFPEGSLILVNAEAKPKPGQFVVARLKDSNEFTFKQLVRDAGDLFLKPLNPSYPIKPLNDRWEITGTVVDAKLPPSLFS